MSKHWLTSGCLKAEPEGEVSYDEGRIEGVSVVREGQAEGHGVWLDESFVDTIVEQGNEKKQGVKSRFGHPTMSSTALGTFLGRLKNFRKEATSDNDGQQITKAVADLFLSNEAKETPNGDLFSYVVGMAKNESDMFGTSIVFQPGKTYRKTKSGRRVWREYSTNEKGEHLENADGTLNFRWVDDNGNEPPDNDPVIDRDYATCEKLHFSDCVDDPAANDGLFSTFAKETVAGQIHEFFDMHPQVFDSLIENPQVIEAISQYGDKIEGFIERYRQYQQKQQEEGMSKQTTSEKETQELEAQQEAETSEEQTSEDTGEDTGEGAGTEAGEETGAESTGEGEEETQEEEETEEQSSETGSDDTFSRAEFKKLKEQYGAEIAADVVLSGGGEKEAAQKRIEALESELEQAKKARGGKPAQASSTASSKKSLWG